MLRYPIVRWVGNTGSLAYVARRITGRIHTELVRVAVQQEEDGEDYTEEVRELTRAALWEEAI